MNGVGLTVVDILLGHRKRVTTTYAHLKDVALCDAATQAATVIARAMGYTAEPSPLSGEVSREGKSEVGPDLLRRSEQSPERARRSPFQF